MGTTDLTGVTGSLTNAPQAKIGQDDLLVFKEQVDFAAHNMAVNDILDLFVLPPGILVVNAMCVIDTPEGSAATGDLGVTTGTGIEYLDAADMNLAAGGASVSGRGATTEDASFVKGGRYLSASERVSFKALAALANGKATFVITAIDVRDD